MTGNEISDWCFHLHNLWKWKLLSRLQLIVTPWTITVHGILQATILEWIAFPFSRGSSQARDRTQVSRIAGGLFPNWATREAHKYLSGEPIPSPVDLPDPGIKPGSPALQADSLPTELSEKPGNLYCDYFNYWSLLRWMHFSVANLTFLDGDYMEID